MIGKDGRVMSAAYGFDPYNTTQGLRPFNYNGPLTPIAYREQASWDFTPGSQQDKLNYWHQYGMHRLPLRNTPARTNAQDAGALHNATLPALLRRQAE